MLLSFLSYIQQQQAKDSRDVMHFIPSSSLERQQKYKCLKKKKRVEELDNKNKTPNIQYQTQPHLRTVEVDSTPTFNLHMTGLGFHS